MDEQTEAILTKISEQIAIEMERRDLEQQRLRETSELKEAQIRTEIQSRRRARMQEEILRRYSNLSEEISGVLPLVIDLKQAILELLGWQEGAQEKLESIERLLYLLIGRQKNGGTEVLAIERKESLKRQLAQYQINLNLAQEKASRRGQDVPIELENEISDYKFKIKLIHEELDS